jgi:transcriptional regulator with XRE-family HTH domain
MIQVNELKGVIVKNGLSQKDVAKHLGISDKTFYEKMKKGVFDSDEIESMIHLLGINDPVQIFFCQLCNLIGYKHPRMKKEQPLKLLSPPHPKNERRMSNEICMEGYLKSHW